MADARERLLKHYEDVERVLQKAETDVICISATTCPLSSTDVELLHKCTEAIEKMGEDFRREKENMPKGIAWDTCSIVFLGETNSGKSTLIEALRVALTKGDEKNDACWGVPIGDGSPDFTRDVVRHELRVAGHRVVLEDLPGIEGKEKALVANIERGLREANVVIYLVGNGKKPERGTVAKIRRYLRQDALVYAICNVHCAPKANRTSLDGIYEENLQEKYEDAEREAARQTQAVMKNILGANFRAVYCMNAQLAFCAAAYDRTAGVTEIVPERDGLRKAQEKYAREFAGDYDAMQELSRLSVVEGLVKSCAGGFARERIEQCKRKMKSHFRRWKEREEENVGALALLQDVCRELREIEAGERKILQKLNLAHGKFKERIELIPVRVAEKYREHYAKKLYANIEEWEEFDKDRAESFMERYKEDMQEYIKGKVEKRVREAAKILEEEYRQAGRRVEAFLWQNFETRIQSSAESAGLLSTDFNKEDTLFSDIFEGVFSVLGAVAIRGVLAAFFGLTGPAGWILGGLFVVAEKLLRYLMSREERVAKAKNAAYEFLTKLEKKLQESLQDKFDEVDLGEQVRRASYRLIEELVEERRARFFERVEAAACHLQEELACKAEEIGGYSYGEA